MKRNLLLNNKYMCQLPQVTKSLKGQWFPGKNVISKATTTNSLNKRIKRVANVQSIIKSTDKVK